MASFVMNGLVDAANYSPKILATCHYCGGNEMWQDYYSDCVQCKCGAKYTWAAIKSKWNTNFYLNSQMTRDKAIALNNGA